MKRIFVLVLIAFLITSCNQAEESYETTVCKVSSVYYEKDVPAWYSDAVIMIRSRSDKIFYEFVVSKNSISVNTSTFGINPLTDEEQDLIKEINKKEGIFYSREESSDENFEHFFSIFEHYRDKLQIDSLNYKMKKLLGLTEISSVQLYTEHLTDSYDTVSCQTY